MDKEAYEKDLKSRQKEHLDNVLRLNQGNTFIHPWKPCLHDQCYACHGTGITATGQHCIHMLSCDCPKCACAY